jgi:hypothetical protein
MTQALSVAGVTLVQNEQGVALKYGWLYNQQISVADALRIRDWLDAVYPKAECKCQAK